MGKRTDKELSSAAERFCTDGKMYECEPYGNGHINDTFLMKCRNENGETVSYIMQAVNTNVFREPEKLMDNIYAVTEFLKKSETDPRKVLTLVKTLSGDKCYFDKNGTRLIAAVSHSSFQITMKFIDGKIIDGLKKNRGCENLKEIFYVSRPDLFKDRYCLELIPKSKEEQRKLNSVIKEIKKIISEN